MPRIRLLQEWFTGVMNVAECSVSAAKPIHGCLAAK
jgi:hypothetical protein